MTRGEFYEYFGKWLQLSEREQKAVLAAIESFLEG